MVTHELKTDIYVFEAVRRGSKTYEIRYNDRNFAVGDELWLKETKYTGAQMQKGKPLEYTGRMIAKTVSHILHGPVYGLMPGWVIMSFACDCD